MTWEIRMVLSQRQVPTEFLLTHPYAMALVSPYGKWMSSDSHNRMALQRTEGDRTMIYMSSKNRLNDEANVYGDTEKRSNGRYSREKFWEDLLSLFINIWPNNVCSLASCFSGFVFPTSAITKFSKEAWAVGWRACSTSPAPGEGRCCSRVEDSSSSSSLRWRPQPMLPGYLPGRRVGSGEREEEKEREYTPGKLGWLWVSLRHRYSRKGKAL